jgi:hypothetical protein
MRLLSRATTQVWRYFVFANDDDVRHTHVAPAFEVIHVSLFVAYGMSAIPPVITMLPSGVPTQVNPFRAPHPLVLRTFVQMFGTPPFAKFHAYVCILFEDWSMNWYVDGGFNNCAVNPGIGIDGLFVSVM